MMRARRLVSVTVGMALVGLAGLCIGGSAGAEVRTEGACLFIDDEPFFPYGLLWTPSVRPAEMARHHLNCLMVNQDLTVVPEAERYGLKLIGRPFDSFHEMRARDDVIAWFIHDDASTGEALKRSQRYVERIRNTGDRRPTFANEDTADPDRHRPFVELLDIYSPYDYPLPRYTLEWYAHDYLDSLRFTFDRPTIWSVLQCSGMYSRNRWIGFDDRQMVRLLEPAHLRLLVWTALSHGVRGIFFWPDYGLFHERGWARDRLQEATILGLEIEVLTHLLIEGTEVRDAASISRPDVTVCRIDRGEEVLLLLTHRRVDDRFAVDGNRAFGVRVAVAGSFAPETRAVATSFPSVRELAVRPTADGVEITLDSLDLTEAIVLTPRGQQIRELAQAVRDRLPTAADHAVALSTIFSEKADVTLGQLQALEALPPRGPSRWARLDLCCAFDAPDPSEVASRPHAAYEAARAQERRVRAVLAACRRHADRYASQAPPGAASFRMSPFTLPEFFSSFDFTRVTD